MWDRQNMTSCEMTILTLRKGYTGVIIPFSLFLYTLKNFSYYSVSKSRMFHKCI